MMKLRDIQFYSIFAILVHVTIWLLVIHLVFNLSGLYEVLIVTFIEKKAYFDEAFIVIPSLLILFE